MPESTHLAAVPTNTRKAVLLVLLGFGVGLLVSGLVIAAGSHEGSVWSRMWSRIAGRDAQIDVRQPTVVHRIQQLQRLETVVYTMDKLVTGGRESSIWPDFLAADRLLLLVHGEVVAGIDFANLQPGDVTVRDKQILIHLPQAQVFSTRLDSGKTRVYSRRTGLLVSSDPNLESEVRQAAEKDLHDSAVTDGILRTAEQNGKSTLTSLLQELGFTEIRFQ